MADISMCDFHECPLSSTCFRYLAKASDYQCYFILTDEDKENIKRTNTCDMYWKCDSKALKEQYDNYWRD